MKFVKKPVQNGGKMFFIAYQREDGTERICTEVGLSEAFPEERATNHWVTEQLIPTNLLIFKRFLLLKKKL